MTDQQHNPLLSVFMITYNHGPYIAQALDSILMQEVDFDYEIVVGEDNSTDDSRAILLQYRDKYPDKFRLILHDKNVGPWNNQIITLKACRGKYLAFLEGDDYWSDTKKLQKQVSFLESHQGYSACFHNVLIKDQDVKGEIYVYESVRKEDITLADLGDGDYMKTCSLVCLNKQEAFSPMYKHLILAKDTSIGYCLLFDGSLAHYFTDVMAVYRRHIGGVIGKLSHERKLLHSLDYLRQCRAFYRDDILRPRLDKLFRFHCRQLMRIYARNFQVLKLFKIIVRRFRDARVDTVQD